LASPASFFKNQTGDHRAQACRIKRRVHHETTISTRTSGARCRPNPPPCFLRNTAAERTQHLHVVLAWPGAESHESGPGAPGRPRSKRPGGFKRPTPRPRLHALVLGAPGSSGPCLSFWLRGNGLRPRTRLMGWRRPASASLRFWRGPPLGPASAGERGPGVPLPGRSRALGPRPGGNPGPLPSVAPSLRRRNTPAQP